EDDDADRRLLEVERLPLDAGARELDHLAGHDAGQAVDARDAVAHFEDAPRLARIDLLADLINFRLENRNDLAGSEAHVYCSRFVGRACSADWCADCHRRPNRGHGPPRPPADLDRPAVA